MQALRRTAVPGIHGVSIALVFAFGCGQDGLHAFSETAVIIAGFKTRGDLLVNNSLGQRIRQNTFKAVTHLQKHFAILNEHEEYRAVVFGLLPDAPFPRDAHGVIFDGGVRLHLRIDGNENLLGGLALEILELLI